MPRPMHGETFVVELEEINLAFRQLVDWAVVDADGNILRDHM